MTISSKKWFHDARFGAFIHWGIYALPGGGWKGQIMDYIGEWIQAKYRIPHAEYALLTHAFNPVNFDADIWIEKLTAAGMRYLVFTAKHHDGFAMYHSRVSNFNIVDATPWSRDPLAELAAACRKYGMKLGIYYSHCLDWSDPDAADPGPEWPKNFGMSWGNDWDFPNHKEKDFERYLRRKALPQIEELMTGYGEIAVLWLDCPIGLKHEQAQRIVELVKKHQPQCLINSRIGCGLGDYGSMGDNQHPYAPSEIALETPATLNDSWGFKWSDNNWKPATQIAHELVHLASKGVNYLLNVGPRPDGAFPEATDRILAELAEWMLEASPAIHGCSASPFTTELPGMWCTTREKHLFIFSDKTENDLVLNGLQVPVARVGIAWHMASSRLKLNTLLGHIDVEFRDDLKIDERLMPQNGILQLFATTATVYRGKSGTDGSDIHLGAAAEIIAEDAPCSIEPGGFWSNWHHPGDRLSWKVYFPAGGSYQVELLTINQLHSAPWAGDRTVIFKAGDTQVCTELKADTHIDSNHYYAAAISRLGTLTIKESGESSLSLETLNINSNAAKTMAFAKLTITAVCGSSE